VFRRPELLVAASVPVLLLAGVLSWQRDVLCTQSGCGTVAASAWTGSPVWAVVLTVALALGGVWVLLPPTRGRMPLGVAALTGVAGVVSAAIVVVSLDALVFNQAGFFGFDLPVTETFPVLAVHPGPGLLLGLLGLLLQAAGGWTSVRHRTALLTTPRRHQARPSTQPWPAVVPPPAQPWPPATPSPAQAWETVAPPPAPTWETATPSPAQPWETVPPPAPTLETATPSPAQPWETARPSPARPRETARPSPGRPPVAGGPPAQAWEAVAFGQGAPPPRRHRRRG
jgi:hypothetical protein